MPPRDRVGHARHQRAVGRTARRARACTATAPLVRASGNRKPRRLPALAWQSAAETVNRAIPATVAGRAQPRGSIVNGPLAVDNAVELAAPKTEGRAGMAAGHADGAVARLMADAPAAPSSHRTLTGPFRVQPEVAA